LGRQGILGLSPSGLGGCGFVLLLLNCVQQPSNAYGVCEGSEWVHCLAHGVFGGSRDGAGGISRASMRVPFCHPRQVFRHTEGLIRAIGEVGVPATYQIPGRS
jgi:hypothetical protein